MNAPQPDPHRVRALAIKGACWGAFVGLALGLLYSFGGLIHDLLTVGLNAGTALAFLALVGMPLIFAVPGFLGGLLVSLFHGGMSGAR
ncbi:hypothetical protein Mal4_57520 [Maioricimonas rarisocia]|uniref:Major facilitator superfamily (MFS) profile domain-containing protein n=1 Tax=Maioricimonas rarisocia TaxID=2528026 RepID=A0A517ZFY4_9PLAN|nr:hypothetical protein [Maioricimonas rarisocia]QDU41385.1 hypothetical protein Mal4_57520 [Maioricimonas rarisocia]